MLTKFLPINFTKPLFLVKIDGESCWPELVPGNYYLATSLFRPKVGDFIVFKNPANPAQVLVKKIKSEKGRAYEVSGTVGWSTSSEDFGPISKKEILGKITHKDPA